MTPRFLTICVALIGLLASAGPAPAQSVRQTCGPVTPPDAADREAVARDSVRDALREAMRREAVARGVAAGIERPTGLLVIVRQPGSAAPQLKLHRSNVPTTALSGLEETLQPLLAGWPDSVPASVYLRLDETPRTAAAGAGPRTECRPALVNREFVAREIEAFARDNPQVRGRRAATVWVLVDREGDVAHARLHRASGLADFDRRALEIGERLRFRPARLDGETLDVWVQIPLVLQARSPAARRGAAGRP